MKMSTNLKSLLFVVMLALLLSLIVPAAAQDEELSGTITIWGWTAAIRDVLETAGLIEDFQALHPNVEIEIIYYGPADVYTNLPLALTAGTGACDVCLVESSNLANFVHMGGLLDLTEQIEPYIDVMNEYRWTDAELDGRFYAMPWDSGPVVMYYRRDVFEQAGLPTEPEEVDALVDTWDDYFETCQTIVAETGLPCFAHNRANNYGRLYEMVLWSRGLGYYDAETGEVTVDSPENIETLEMFGRFWDEELVSDSLEWTDPWYAEFSSLEEPNATIVIASWMEVFMKDWLAPGTEGLWGAVRMPAWDAENARAANDGGSTFVIPAQSQNPEAAWAFIEFALGDRENQLTMFEISGFIPALETTYDDPIFDEPDEFFAGQATRQLYADVLQDIPSATIYGPHYSMMNGAVSVAIQRYATGDATAEEALRDAAEEIRANLD
jgi:lactose/L-arabinose transport system substrate-binding protein